MPWIVVRFILPAILMGEINPLYCPGCDPGPLSHVVVSTLHNCVLGNLIEGINKFFKLKSSDFFNWFQNHNLLRALDLQGNHFADANLSFDRRPGLERQLLSDCSHKASFKTQLRISPRDFAGVKWSEEGKLWAFFILFCLLILLKKLSCVRNCRSCNYLTSSNGKKKLKVWFLRPWQPPTDLSMYLKVLWIHNIFFI